FWKSTSAFLSRIPCLDHSSDIVDPRGHIDSAARCYNDDRVFVLRCDSLDQFILPGRQFKGAVPAFGFALGSEPHREHNRIRLGREFFYARLHPSCLWHDSHTDEWRAESGTGMVLKNDLVRPRIERQTALRDDEFLAAPVIENKLVVDIHAESTG